MFFHLKPLLLVLVFFVGQELLIYRPGISWFVFLISLLLIFWFSFKLSGVLWGAFFPVLFFLGAYFLLPFVSGGSLIQIYIFFLSFLFYLIELGIFRFFQNQEDETAQRLGIISGILTVFIWASFLFAVYLNRNIPFWNISLVFAGVVFGVSYGILFHSLCVERKRLLLFYSLLLTYFITVIFSGMYFLPFGYLTLGALILAIYFFLTNSLVAALKGKLTRISFSGDLFVFLLAGFLLLASARWEMVFN